MPICFMYCPTVRSEMIFQTRSSPIWFSLNARLLHQKMCYLLSWLNRRVPNGTHGGVRGRGIYLNSPPTRFMPEYYLEYYYLRQKIWENQT